MGRPSRRWLRAAWLGLLVVAWLVGGCGVPSGQGSRPRLRLVHALWKDGQALALAAAVVAEDRLGYDVEVRQTGLDEGLRMVVAGEADAFLALWLPETNESQIATHGPGLADMGPAVTGARAGLVAPIDLPAESIADLDRLADELGGKILSIEAEGGMGRKTQEAVKVYDLDLRVQHMPTGEMLEVLAKALADGEPVVASGWQPHWMFDRFRLKFLADPEGVFGDEERLHPVAHRGLEARDPRAAALLRGMRFDEARFDSLLSALHEGAADPEAAVRGWITAEPTLVDGWLEGVPASP